MHSPALLWEQHDAASTSKAPAQPLLLWIDDFEPGLALYKLMFENLGFRVLTASSGADGLQLAALYRPDIVVTDYEMPQMDGEAVAVALKAMNPKTPVVMFSGSTLIPARVGRAVNAFCDKAASRDQLLATIHRLLTKKHNRGLGPRPLAAAPHSGHTTVA